MKYNEAIDMILDGGEAYNKENPKYRFYFENDELLGCPDSLGARAGMAEFHKTDFKSDWIVEKDGVVYEKYKYQCNCPWPNYADEIKCTSVCLKCNYPREIFPRELEGRRLWVKSRIYEQDERAEIEEGSEPWEKIKMPTIADEVNEDWLEKKMLCFQDRLRTAPGLERTHTTDSKCQNDECHFCLPSPSIKNDHSERSREKVTMDEIKSLICEHSMQTHYCLTSQKNGDHYGYQNHGKNCAGIYSILAQKLEILISLQEKE